MQQLAEPETTGRRFGRGPAEERELPEAPPLRRLIGPSVILVGVGVASGEYILFPYIASQAGLVFLWAAIIGVAVQFFINMEIERYTLATGETAIGSFQRLWRPWGAILAVGAVLATMWPGWATSAATVGDVRDRRRRPEPDRDHHPARHRRDPDRLAGRLPDRREAGVHQGRGGPGVHRRRTPRRDQGDRVRGHVQRRHELRDVPEGDRARDPRRRAGRGRRRRREQPGAEQLDPRQGLRHGPLRAAHRLADHGS